MGKLEYCQQRQEALKKMLYGIALIGESNEWTRQDWLFFKLKVVCYSFEWVNEPSF